MKAIGIKKCYCDFIFIKIQNYFLTLTNFVFNVYPGSGSAFIFKVDPDPQSPLKLDPDKVNEDPKHCLPVLVTVLNECCG
jgi:hypothetical protein